ncbi:MAG TPA: MFS transporter [Allocoleopsis sp.]
MLEQEDDRSELETKPLPHQEIPEDIASLETLLLTNPPLKLSKPETRSTLKALTLEGVSGTLFYSIIGGALLSNFLLDLGAGPVEIGMLASIPQLVNLLQPFGAYLSDRMQSRYGYSICIFGPSRLLWLSLVLAIWWGGSVHIAGYQLVQLTLAIIWVTQLLESFGRASWLSWMAALVPQRLRGRYFGFRNSAVSLTNLIGVPLLALVHPGRSN